MTKLMNDRLLRTATYLLITLLLIMTWGMGGVFKLLAGGVPEWFSTQFSKTFLATFPGLTISFYSIAVLETVAAVVALGSLLRGEFLKPVRPTLLYGALGLSMLLFVQLSLGKQLVADFAGSHDLFMYFAGTLVMLLAVRSLDASPVAARA